MDKLNISKEDFVSLMNAITNHQKKINALEIALQKFFYDRPLIAVSEELIDSLLGFLYKAVNINPIQDDILHWYLYEDVDDKNIYNKDGTLFFSISSLEDLYDYLELIQLPTT